MYDRLVYCELNPSDALVAMGLPGGDEERADLCEKSAPMLEGKLVVLCCLERHDLLRNYQWGNSRELIEKTCMPCFPKSANDIDRWFEAGVDSATSKVYAIKTRDGDYIGNIELRDIETLAGRAEMGLFIGEMQSRGKGYGTDAIRVLSGFAFREMRLHRLYAKILEGNRPAQNAFARCGYKLEGTEREAHFAEGRFHNVSLYGLLAQELKIPKGESNETD